MKHQNKQYQHFIFDFDGVMCDSFRSAVMAFNEIRVSEFPCLPEVSSQDDMTVVYSGSLKTCLNKWLSNEETETFFNLHSSAMARLTGGLKTFPSIAKTLTSLGHAKVSIVTSAYSGAVRRILDTDPDFDYGCLHEIVGRELRQSKTIKINRILEMLDLKPTQAVYIGDLESDILYCRDVPMDIISVGYGYHPGHYLLEKGPTYYVDTVQNLRTLLKKMAGNN